MKKVLSLVLALMLVLSCFGSIALADDVPTLKVLVRHDPPFSQDWRAGQLQAR